MLRFSPRSLLILWFFFLLRQFTYYFLFVIVKWEVASTPLIVEQQKKKQSRMRIHVCHAITQVYTCTLKSNYQLRRDKKKKHNRLKKENGSNGWVLIFLFFLFCKFHASGLTLNPLRNWGGRGRPRVIVRMYVKVGWTGVHITSIFVATLICLFSQN